ncbi:Retrovirus-related Pol polyprotein [Labeo rohita]|uniref:Retrovirus-related Pol polyprotein n=1 Tax=Labeo rohita TaxID=84645 RepID=A0ABQ8L3F5_LABRO|nr:Retrovirus-related Pol polyprotein [Labeo rohita]
MSSKFELEKFTIAPTHEQFEKCRKDDLLLIADFFDIVVPCTALKREIKEVLHRELVKQRILPEAGVVSGVASHLELSEGLGAAEAELKSDIVIGIDPIPPSSPDDEMLAVRLKELELELSRQQYQSQLLQIRALELETRCDVRLKELELQLKTGQPPSPSPEAKGNIIPAPVSASSPLERIATTLQWPRNIWPLLLQCKLLGKAQEVCSALTLEQSLDYDAIKAAVLRAYELVPEAYRQKFRRHVKIPSQTFVEFAREKTTLFEKWCNASKVTTFEQLKELILVEEFKNCISEKIVVYLNEQKVSSLADAAVFADKFVLTHKVAFSSPRSLARTSVDRPNFKRTQKDEQPLDPLLAARECYYCHEKGHLIAACPALQRKNQRKAQNESKSVAFVRVPSSEVLNSVDPTFEPFVYDGAVALSNSDSEFRPVRILRDTGAAQSFILASTLPFSSQSSCGSDVLIQGIELGIVRVPLHSIYLRSNIVTGLVKVAVRSQLPVKGISLILGNDLAGSKVSTLPEVVDVPCASDKDDVLVQEFPSVFQSCVVTCAQARKFEDEIDLSDSFLGSEMSDSKAEVENECSSDVIVQPSFDFPFSKQQLISAQKTDETLLTCRSSVVDESDLPKYAIAYFLDDGVLMRKWSPEKVKHDWSSVFQVVVPQPYRGYILSLAHDHELSGHLGVRKTYHNLLKHFFWPGMKSSVSQYCRSCHACQIAGKPNQVVSPAPLKPIPVLNEPFEKLVIDCVGPLPKTKSGYVYLLTMMCSATRFLEAVPLRSLKSPNIVKALVKFCTTFGLPKVIQSDQGTNFTSRIFRKVMNELNITHTVSSAYRPQSQGVIERFHQTLKTMIRTYCVEHQKDWDEQLPLLLFAVHNTVQESLGFSPAELVFGHSLRGPLKLLQEHLLAKVPSSKSPTHVLDHVSSFCERLHSVWNLAPQSLLSAQSKMKDNYDKKSVKRSFEVGDKVLVLLPLPGSSLQAKFAGPYEVQEKLSDIDYVIRTPERHRKSCVCHINMLKSYVSRSDSEIQKR